MSTSTGRIGLLLAMTKDLAAVRRKVMGKVPELVAGSGYVPFVDYAVPPTPPSRPSRTTWS
jgi:hypothetical protein